jgi:tetratricopeptide (TPR) repeat protein
MGHSWRDSRGPAFLWHGLTKDSPNGPRAFVLTRLTATRGMGATEARICYERAEPLCHSLNQPRLLSLALYGQFRYRLMTDKLSAAMQIIERLYSVVQERNDTALIISACHGLASTLVLLGDFESARQYARRGVQLWRSGNVQAHADEYFSGVVGCLSCWAVCEWHFGEIATCHALRDEGISIARELRDMNALAMALSWAAALATNERDPSEVDRFALEVIELSTRHNFVYWLALAEINRGWARSASGDTAEGIPWIEQGIRDIRATGTVLALPNHLARKADALYLADRTSDALEAINEAIPMAERFELGDSRGEMHRLRGVFLAAMGADETQIEASFCEAIRIAKEQKSVSFEKRAEATFAEYRRQKASASGGRGFRLPL